MNQKEICAEFAFLVTELEIDCIVKAAENRLEELTK